ncbi:hypothetical protein Rctr71_093 [Virus Rctr71]|nr:hypothetical protein Rctr71_093 [Virus Rctr71]
MAEEIKIKASYRPAGGGGKGTLNILNAESGKDVTEWYSDGIKLLAKRAQSGDKEANKLLAYVIVPPIREVVMYTSWTEIFFSRQTGNLMNPYRFAQDSYSMIAVATSFGAKPIFVRPSRTTYLNVTPELFETGLQIQLDQVAQAGWDIVSAKIIEAGEEMARKKDTKARTAMVAAVTALGGNYDVDSATFSYASFQSIVKNSVLGFPVTVAAMNTKRAFDMTDWTLPANSMWMVTQETGERVLLNQRPTEGMTLQVLDTQIRLRNFVPYNEIWFGHAEGQDWEIEYGTWQAQDDDVMSQSRQYAWRENLVHLVRSNYRLRRLEITG